MRDAVTTQVQFTCLEGSRRQIPGRKFSARTPKGTQSSVKISSLEKEFVFPYDGTRKHSPAHRSLFYIGGQTSRLNLSSSLLPTIWRSTEFSANIRLRPFIRRGRGYPDLVASNPKHELTRHSSDSFIRFLFESLASSSLVTPSTTGSEVGFCATINTVSPLSWVEVYYYEVLLLYIFIYYILLYLLFIISLLLWSLLHIVRRRNNRVERKNW